MHKIKVALFSIVPMIVSIGIQFFSVYYLLFIAAVFLFGIAPSITGKIYSFYDMLTLASDMDFNTIAMIIFSFSCIIVFGIWYRKRCGGTFHIDIKKEVHPLEVLGIFLLIPGTQYLSSVVAVFISAIFPSWMETYETMLETAGLGENISLIMFIYSVCLAPVSEELIFRGVTLGIARRAFPFWIANILQAFLFGVFHMNPLQGCYTFIIGLILGYICHKGGSIYHAVFFHFLFNLWGTTAAQWMININPLLQGCIVILSLFLGLSFGFFFFHMGNQRKTENHNI